MFKISFLATILLLVFSVPTSAQEMLPVKQSKIEILESKLAQSTQDYKDAKKSQRQILKGNNRRAYTDTVAYKRSDICRRAQTAQQAGMCDL